MKVSTSYILEQLEHMKNRHGLYALLSLMTGYGAYSSRPVCKRTGEHLGHQTSRIQVIKTKCKKNIKILLNDGSNVHYTVIQIKEIDTIVYSFSIHEMHL